MFAGCSRILRQDSRFSGLGKLSTWVNSTTVKTAQCVISNIFLEVIGSGLLLRGVANLPLRLWSCVDAYQKREYWKIALDIVSLSAVLLLPYGWALAIVIDVAVMVIDIAKKTLNAEPVYSLKTKMDCSIRENALTVLGLTEEEACDRSTLDARYKKLSTAFDKRIEQTKGFPLSQAFTTLRSQVEEAYVTLEGRKR